MSNDAVYINTGVILERSEDTDLAVLGIAMDLIMVVWAPSKQPIELDFQKLSDQLNAVFTKRGYTPALFEKYRGDLRAFFVELPDGRWVPDPEILVVNDPEGESVS